MHQNQNRVDFVGLGFCSNDDICLLPEIPIDHKVQIIEHIIQGGGPGGTATVAAAKLGLSAAFISAVGDDAAGDRMIADFEADGVSTVGIVRRKDSMSPLAYCWIDAPTGKRSVAWTRGTLKELLPSEVDMNLVRSAKILHLDGHNTEAAIAAAAEAKKAGVIVNFDAGTIRPGVEKIIENTDIFFTSEYFARAWTKEDDLEKALVKLLDEGAKVTGITVGEKGSMAWIDGKIVRCPSFDVGRIVDTTGAGDTFHSAFAVRYLECGDIYESMRFGSAVAGLKCRKLGGRAGLPDRKTVDEFLKNN